MAASPNIRVCCPARVSEIAPDEEKVTLTLESGEQIETRLLVAADGGNSFVRQHFKLPVTRHDFEQHAIIATVKTAQDPEGCAFERFTEGGRWPCCRCRRGSPHWCGASGSMRWMS